MSIDVYIEEFCVKDDGGRFHIIDAKDNIFSVSPRTSGIIVPEQKLKSIDIVNDEIFLTGVDDVTHSYKLLLRGE